LSADTGTLLFQETGLLAGSWGLFSFFVLAAVDYRRVVEHAYLLGGITTVLLLVIVALGESRFGARRWIQLGGFTIQPSEFAKITLVLMLAHYLSYKSDRYERWSFILVPGLLAAIPAILILKQPDLGTAMIFLPLTLGMIYVAGGRMKYILVILLVLAILAPVSWYALKDYQKSRLVGIY